MSKKKKGFLTLENVIENVDEFISAVLYLGYTLIMKGLDGEIVLKTSKELNEKLKDIPENDAVWEKIYKNIPECILYRTARIEQVDDNNNTGIMIITDFKSEEGRKQVKTIKQQLKQIR